MMNEETRSLIHKLEDKFKNSGQDLNAYLDGLLYQKYLTYWDYIHLDTLLSLQVPRTHFPDEEIFIMYHQITELYFKLILHEQKQLVEDRSLDDSFYLERVTRINGYYKALISSFSIMIKGMQREQFMRYRMALLPSSGFQSVQYRMIEIYSTPLEHMVHPEDRNKLNGSESIEVLFEMVYWKKGATDINTGEKTLTLKQFEQRYTPRMLRIAHQVQEQTLYHKTLQLEAKGKLSLMLRKELQLLDLNANVNWPLMHYGSAHRYLNSPKNKIGATGGTNWKDYLPPSFQKIIFFPNLHSEMEREEWGKEWVSHHFNPEKIKS